MFNLREGWVPADDWLPDRLLREPLVLASGRVAGAVRGRRLRGMVDGYYAARGLDAEGRLPADVADDLLLGEPAVS